jgi:hypothetical protein
MCDFFVDDLDVGAVRKPVQWVAVAPPLVVRHKQKCAGRAALRVVHEPVSCCSLWECAALLEGMCSF